MAELLTFFDLAQRSCASLLLVGRTGFGFSISVRNGLYSFVADMEGGKERHTTGIILLRDRRIFGGDNYFYHTGSYSEAAINK